MGRTLSTSVQYFLVFIERFGQIACLMYYELRFIFNYVLHAVFLPCMFNNVEVLRLQETRFFWNALDRRPYSTRVLNHPRNLWRKQNHLKKKARLSEEAGPRRRMTAHTKCTGY